MQESKIYRSRRGTATFFIPFGVAILCFAVALPFLLKSPLAGFFLMSVPMIFGGFVVLMYGISAVYSRMEITEGELKMVLPGWRALPVLPMRKACLRWSEVRAVRHRVDVYTIFIPPWLLVPYPLDMYAIDTDNERILVPREIVRRLPEAIGAICDYSGHPLQTEPQASVSFFRTLFFGTPTWPGPFPERRHSSTAV
ncbi:MAG: hypothetical protein ACP5SH_10700 [Syntrophobacteraceae bacterium]